MGVKMAPQVVPSWHDMLTNSDFLKQIFANRLKGSPNQGIGGKILEHPP
ncbi:MAG: hypothetical protein ACI9R3_005664 [Verrucomicrobiales bacterium]|jgi:hypothetical protein